MLVRGSNLGVFGNAGVSFVSNKRTEWFAGGRMLSWWKSPSSSSAKKKNVNNNINSSEKKKKNKDNGILHSLSFRKLKGNFASPACRRESTTLNHVDDSDFEIPSPSTSNSTSVTRCQSFSHALPLPLPCMPPASILGRTESGISLNRSGHFLPLPSPQAVLNRSENAADGSALSGSDSATSSMVGSDDQADRDPSATIGSCITFAGSAPKNSKNNTKREIPKPNISLLSKHNNLPIPPKRGFSSNREPPKPLQIPVNRQPVAATDSSTSTPSSPMRGFSSEHSPRGGLCMAKPYLDGAMFGSGNCSSPGSGYNSGQNSIGGDMVGQPFWHNRGGSPVPSPRMRSPGPSSRAQSAAVSPLHPRASGLGTESPTGRQEEGKQQCHPLPLPPRSPSSSSPFTTSATSSGGPRSPGGKDNPASPGQRWKKGKLLGRGTFGHVYVGFNNESGEMCAMKEVTLFSDDPKSKESVKQLAQEISMLSHLRHPNIVQYYGSETVDDMLYIYLEYVSGGSIHKLLQEYGQFGEPVVRSYTHQILCGLAYLHNRNTVHRDVKGANILVDPNGHVKLADFGMAKHITAHSCLLSFKGSPYWMAPEVIKNVNGYDLAVDIWSLGCTVLEMATAQPPWSQYEGVAAMFKIGNSKELPAIPDHLSEQGKNFVKLCLQRNPVNRPTATQLLEHPFVKNAAPLVKLDQSAEGIELLPSSANGSRPLHATQCAVHSRNFSSLEMDYSALHSKGWSPYQPSSDHFYVKGNISLPVSPSASPLIQPRSPHHRYGGMSPSPISTPLASSGSSTPLTGGYGAIPFQANGAAKSAVHLQENFGNMPRLANGLHTNCSGGYPDPRPDVYGGAQIVRTPEGSPRFQNHIVAESDVLGKNIGRVMRNEHGQSQRQYSGQGALAEHVSQQLLKTPKPVGIDFISGPPKFY